MLLLATEGRTPTGRWVAESYGHVRLDGASVQGSACRNARNVPASGAALGTMPLRSGDVLIAAYTRDANCVAAPDARLALPGRWLPIYLLDLSGGRSASGAFDVVVPLDGGRLSVPLRVRFPS